MNAAPYPQVVMPECPAEKLLVGQKTLVTVAASGIGRAVAIEFGNAGADVVVNYRGGADLAEEGAPYGIRLNSIAPGAIRTPINSQTWDTRKAYDELMELVPYRRIGEPENIARAAVWLASDHSDYVNGVSLVVDDGMTLYPGFATGG